MEDVIAVLGVIIFVAAIFAFIKKDEIKKRFGAGGRSKSGKVQRR